MNSSQKLASRIAAIPVLCDIHGMRAEGLALIGCLLTSSLAQAYDLETHADISRHAVQNSKYSRYLANIGLTSLDQKLSDGQIHFPTKLAVVDWVREGSRREDDLPSLRFLNHFYNPLNGQGLSGAFAGRPSLDWGL